jgi:hypothetical protein
MLWNGIFANPDLSPKLMGKPAPDHRGKKFTSTTLRKRLKID